MPRRASEACNPRPPFLQHSDGRTYRPRPTTTVTAETCSSCQCIAKPPRNTTSQQQQQPEHASAAATSPGRHPQPGVAGRPHRPAGRPTVPRTVPTLLLGPERHRLRTGLVARRHGNCSCRPRPASPASKDSVFGTLCANAPLLTVVVEKEKVITPRES